MIAPRLFFLLALACRHARRSTPPRRPRDVRQALAFALSFDGRKRWRQADDQMARITADHLVRYLEMAGFVVMRRRAEGTSPEWREGQDRRGSDLGSRKRIGSRTARPLAAVNAPSPSLTSPRSTGISENCP